MATVPPQTKRAAVAAMQHGCAALGFALPPEMRFCTPVTNQAELDRVVALTPRGELAPPGYRFSFGGQFNGVVDGKHFVLWVRVGMSAKETAITVLHELGHLHYKLSGQPSSKWGSPERAAEEADVERWAQAQYRQQQAKGRW